MNLQAGNNSIETHAHFKTLQLKLKADFAALLAFFGVIRGFLTILRSTRAEVEL